MKRPGAVLRISIGAVGVGDGDGGDLLALDEVDWAPPTAAPSGSVTVPRTMTPARDGGDQEKSERESDA